MNYLLVFLGGGAGSIVRYAISHLMSKYALTFPYATLIANALSCIVFGAIATLILHGKIIEPRYRLLVLTGFCGGFSTFSTFSNETFTLFANGQWGFAFANIVASIVICLFCIYLGMKMIQA
jgi:CrcB protein